ncbi:LOW QUALITY PROTEIN: protein SRG1-like [Salvia miltiorrhiza]|uniref:LOW QUALITY PROTEIN: protein SRG1-like n=1 Tax=Salvia miltiorrhiza TaxID=226208 RepID=UPI0025ABBE4C|nr:LOW QUALITY PROTEIN: protein SRG1-like [Salvia miltiorrhiza]
MKKIIHISSIASSFINMADLEQISVQELMKTKIHEIPQKYVIDQEPAMASESSVPIVDMKSFFSSAEAKAWELEKFHSACKEWGIFQLVNHGLEASLLERLRREIQEFYALPLEERLKYRIRAGEFEGYGQHLLQNSGDQKVDWADRFYMITNPIRRRKPHLFPELPDSLRESLEGFISELQKLAKALLGLVAEALKIDIKDIEEMFEDGMQSVRMNYYPPCPEPDKVIGLTPHSDGSGLTILLQVNGVEGLQIKKDGVWMPVKFLPEALAVNLGDIVEVLSNGLYKSIEHRATVNSEKERISIAMFCNPNFQANVGPSPALLTHQTPIFKTMSMEEYVNGFFSRRLKGKFLDTMRI